MFQIGNNVRILSPFGDYFNDVYEITDIVTNSDGQIVYIIGSLGDNGGFDAIFLEAAE
jgi:hypothetical protein